MRNVLAALIGIQLLVSPVASTADSDALEELRTTFLDGQRAASRGQILLARQNLRHLEEADYILAPYLQLSIMLDDLHEVPDTDIHTFMQDYKGTWLSEKMRLNWLIVLRSRRDYQTYVDNFVVGTGNASQQCFYYESLYRLGQETVAFEGAKQLWLVAESQSSGCDWIFTRWRNSDSYSEEYLWQRFILARRAGETSLARYLESIVREPEIQLRMQAYHKIRSEPEVLSETDAFISGGIAYSPVIAQGLRNLAEKDLQLSVALWPEYQQSDVMTIADQAYALDEILDQLRQDERHQTLFELAAEHPSLLPENTISTNFTLAASEGDWHRALAWLDLLPDSESSGEQWQYWRARSMLQLGEPAEHILESLAGARSYYGFLSSMQTHRTFNLNDRSTQPRDDWHPDPLIAQALQRAMELEAVDYSINAQLTWQHATRLLDDEETVQAAWWAAQSGLHFLAIQATIKSGAWDELEIRFPLAFMDEFSTTAAQTQMPLPWLFAISRQESSFAADIQSPAGAMGLMQLMPGTARQMARAADLAYDRNRLVEPDYNIRLGTSYLALAYQEFEGNPVLATAAYNAGIARVKSWLRDQQNPLALDIWIESIPFRETRNYVKNVLAYSVIYGAKLGQPSLMELLGPQLFETSLQTG